jgi:hypothetical protein
VTVTLALTTEQNRGKSAKDRLIEGEEILRLKSLGHQVSELCDRFDISEATLYRRLDAAVKARIAPTVDAYREEQNRLLDDLMSKWSAQCDAGEVLVAHGATTEDMALVERGAKMRGDALNGMLRVSERRAKLNGLDAPVRAEVSVTVTTPVDAAVAALAAEVEQVAG